MFGAWEAEKNRMDSRIVRIDPWIESIQPRLVNDLPPACAGACTVYEDDVRWVLLDPHTPWRSPGGRANDWAVWCAEFVEEHGVITVRNVAEHFGVPEEEARGGFWLVALECWDRRWVSAAS